MALVKRTVSEEVILAHCTERLAQTLARTSFHFSAPVLYQNLFCSNSAFFPFCPLLLQLPRNTWFSPDPAQFLLQICLKTGKKEDLATSCRDNWQGGWWGFHK